jgi:hypothetical protein
MISLINNLLGGHQLIMRTGVNARAMNKAGLGGNCHMNHIHSLTRHLNQNVDERHKPTAKGDTIMLFFSQVSTEVKPSLRCTTHSSFFFGAEATQENCSSEALLGR